jgi:type I restriction enzyme M protein
MATPKYEHLVDDAVRDILKDNVTHLGRQNNIPATLKPALKKASKSGSSEGTPDFTIIYNHPKLQKFCVVIENKYGLDKLALTKVDGSLSTTKKAINNFAANGADHYAKAILRDSADTFDEVLAIGIAGEQQGDDMVLAARADFHFSLDHDPKHVEVDDVHVLLSHLYDDTILDYYTDISLDENDLERIQKDNHAQLQKTAKELNKLFYDYAVPVDERVVIVSGMLLAMHNGLEPDGLQGLTPGSNVSDGAMIFNRIDIELSARNMPSEKRSMMLSTFSTPLTSDIDRDKAQRVGTFRTGSRKGKAIPNISINKEIFTFIYDHVWQIIDRNSHLDSLGEMYSIFLKYALGDGKENGIVLTPPYVTKLMNELIEVDRYSKVLDPCTGSAGFLVSSMSHMIEDMRAHEPTNVWDDMEKHIKIQQLLGLENDRKMFSLAATNMILRGDGSSQIMKRDFFDAVKHGAVHMVDGSQPDKGLLNPPFSYAENGMPFTLESLNALQRGGKLAVIIQDSAGTGKAIATNQQILQHHTLLGSIRMPGDLFEPSAGVQTSIYIFEAWRAHDVNSAVRFIDFADDGYKRTGRGLKIIGDPVQRYEDVLAVWKHGERANTATEVDFVNDTISLDGNDWNYTQHMVIDTVSTEEDFMKTVSDYMSFELSMVLSGKGHLIGLELEHPELLEQAHPEPVTEKPEAHRFEEFELREVFEIVTGSLAGDLKQGNIPRITPSSRNNGLSLFTEDNNPQARYFEDIVTVSFLGDVFYQPKRVSLEMKVHGLKLKEGLGFRKGTYVATSVKKSISERYDYGTQLSSEKLKTIPIELPVTPTGDIDWDYMEQYITWIETRERE